MISTLVILAALAGFDIAADLTQLDETLERASVYQAAHERRIQSFEHDLATGKASTDAERYEVYGSIYELAYPFKYDLAIDAIESQEKLALKMGRNDLLTETRLRKAILYCTAGLYVECSEIAEKIDTTSFTSDTQKFLYYEYQQRFCRDFREYREPGKGGELDERAGYYRGRLIEFLPQVVGEQHRNDGPRALRQPGPGAAVDQPVLYQIKIGKPIGQSAENIVQFHQSFNTAPARSSPSSPGSPPP